MEQKFRNGTKVRVKSLDQIDRDVFPEFVPEMEQYAGEEFTIVEMEQLAQDPFPVYHLEDCVNEDDFISMILGRTPYWSFNEDWLEEVEA